MMVAWRVCLVINCVLYRVVASHSISPAFAGGFGNAKPAKKGATGKKKNAGLSEMVQLPPPAQEIKKDEPKLDKWGLPVASLSDLFPPLPPHTDLVPADTQAAPSLTEIQQLLENHSDLRLEKFFDENCTEKSDGDMQIKLLHKSPPVLAIENFFTDSDCEDMKKATQSGHEVDSVTFTGALSTRTSTSWFCRFQDVPVFLAKANRVLNVQLENMEEPQVVRYQKGQEFSWHYDEVPFPQLKNGGQRVATLLVYLTDVDVECGGGTAFRDLQTIDGTPLVMQPKKGTALLFFPAFRDGTPDDRTLHRSEAMTCDLEKWIVQLWVHKEAYDAVLPPGNSKVAAKSKMAKKIQELGYGED